MEVGADEQVRKAVAHFQAARRLMDGARRHPEAQAGLRRSLRFHRERAATLSYEICGKTAASGQPGPGAALPSIADTGWRAPTR
jgi:hypothetical protein